MTRFHIEHLTRYRYAQSVDLNYGEARMLPRDTPGQRVLESHLELHPSIDDSQERRDAWGNRVVWFMSRQPHHVLSVTGHSLVEREHSPAATDSPPWEAIAKRQNPLSVEASAAREFCLESPMIARHAEATEYARASFPAGRPLLEAVADLAARIHAEFQYRPNATDIDTPLSEVLKERHGVCQDFAHLALAGLRGLGLAARYVSGYLETTPPPGQARQVGADATHAWIAVWLPDLGWFDFDPTNGVATGVGHLTLAWGRDYSDVPPFKGVLHGGDTHTLEVGVTVTRLEGEG
ncbi:MAG: transglutaminase family protein [Pseudomonadota bacterium]|nr:transglutaminase family protein [Pseudomonadota bacterium]MDP1903651.1 transglutaminase family protein [Pseudomonadota bacterium]MDP2352819.1 transglutaminase family protein [Pseudomonadota bacterium]